MLKRLWCKMLHKKTWGIVDSQCYEEGSTGLIQLTLDHCKTCDLYYPSVFYIPHAGADTVRLV